MASTLNVVYREISLAAHRCWTSLLLWFRFHWARNRTHQCWIAFAPRIWTWELALYSIVKDIARWFALLFCHTWWQFAEPFRLSRMLVCLLHGSDVAVDNRQSPQRHALGKTWSFSVDSVWDNIRFDWQLVWCGPKWLVVRAANYWSSKHRYSLPNQHQPNPPLLAMYPNNRYHC